MGQCDDWVSDPLICVNLLLWVHSIVDHCSVCLRWLMYTRCCAVVWLHVVPQSGESGCQVNRLSVTLRCAVAVVQAACGESSDDCSSGNGCLLDMIQVMHSLH